MCGIFGYYNFNVIRDRRIIMEILFNGLRRLEYRGYDSAGIAIDSDELTISQKDAPVINGFSRSSGASPVKGATDEAAVEANTEAAAVAAAGGLCYATAPVPGLPHSPSSKSGGSFRAAFADASPRKCPSPGLKCVYSGGVGRDHCGQMAPRPLVIKSPGKVEALVKLAYQQLADDGVNLNKVFKCHAGIAHTRWATHGPPNAVNSHPQLSDASSEFVVVHNGIITNYKAMREFLVEKGEVFVSETDTEVIPKLCKWVYGLGPPMPFSELVMQVTKHIHGAYALLFKSTKYPGELVACKRGSPLLMGIKLAEDTSTHPRLASADDESVTHVSHSLECYIASDASAMVEHTKKVVVLEDEDVLHLRHGAWGIFNAKDTSVLTAVPRELETLDMEVANIMRGGFDHFMQKEIHEQPESISQTMRGRVAFDPDFVGTTHPVVGESYKQHVKLGGLADHMNTIRSSRRIIMVGCGTSFYACLATRQIMEELSHVPVTLELASDLCDRGCPIFRDDTAVFVSQSGETADTIQALKYIKGWGALCVGITNTVGSTIARLTSCGVHINAGCEIGVASTKAYTSQIVTITMVALALSEDSIKERPRRSAIINSLTKLPDAVRQTLLLDADMRQLAERLQGESSLLLFGRGYNYATALEAALKVKEVALMHSEGILAGEMKHGPLALVDEKMPILVIATNDSMLNKMSSVISQLHARGAQLIVLCNACADMQSLSKYCCKLVQVPEVVDCLQPIVNIVPLQLLSYHLTVLRGHNVDQPRNLAKSVTVAEG